MFGNNSFACCCCDGIGQEKETIKHKDWCAIPCIIDDLKQSEMKRESDDNETF